MSEPLTLDLVDQDGAIREAYEEGMSRSGAVPPRGRRRRDVPGGRAARRRAAARRARQAVGGPGRGDPQLRAPARVPRVGVLRRRRQQGRAAHEPAAARLRDDRPRSRAGARRLPPAGARQRRRRQAGVRLQGHDGGSRARSRPPRSCSRTRAWPPITARARGCGRRRSPRRRDRLGRGAPRRLDPPHRRRPGLRRRRDVVPGARRARRGHRRKAADRGGRRPRPDSSRGDARCTWTSTPLDTDGAIRETAAAAAGDTRARFLAKAGAARRRPHRLRRARCDPAIAGRGHEARATSRSSTTRSRSSTSRPPSTPRRRRWARCRASSRSSPAVVGAHERAHVKGAQGGARAQGGGEAALQLPRHHRVRGRRSPPRRRSSRTRASPRTPARRRR